MAGRLQRLHQLYIPVCGVMTFFFNYHSGKSSWPESKIERTLEGAKIGTSKYNVPAVTKLDFRSNVVRHGSKGE